MTPITNKMTTKKSTGSSHRNTITGSVTILKRATKSSITIDEEAPHSKNPPCLYRKSIPYATGDLTGRGAHLPAGSTPAP